MEWQVNNLNNEAVGAKKYLGNKKFLLHHRKSSS